MGAYGSKGAKKPAPKKVAKKTTAKVAKTCSACPSPAKCSRAGVCAGTGKKLRTA